MASPVRILATSLLLLAALGCGPRSDGAGGSGAGTGTGTGTGASAAPPEKVVQLNQPGEEVDVRAALVPGYVVIVDFWAEWCGACKTMEAKFMPIIEGEPRILVRKVDVGDGDTPVAEQYDIGPLPHLRIYDAKGELRYVLQNNAALETGEKALEVLRESTGGGAAGAE